MAAARSAARLQNSPVATFAIDIEVLANPQKPPTHARVCDHGLTGNPQPVGPFFFENQGQGGKPGYAVMNRST